jgi:hypothetical protein
MLDRRTEAPGAFFSVRGWSLLWSSREKKRIRYRVNEIEKTSTN